MPKKTNPPKIGSKWKWSKLPDTGRIVKAIYQKNYGTFIVYSETHKGQEVNLSLCSLKSWAKAEKGSSPYLFPLVEDRPVQEDDNAGICDCGAQDGPCHRPHRDDCSVYKTPARKG